MAALYENLQPESFRLLQFLDESGLVCSIKQYRRRVAPPYIALSYTWGPSPYQKGRLPDTDYSITLNGNNFVVQQNLHDALQHLVKRVRQRNQSLWVDALCINQNDTTERSDQVRHMKEIYENATATFAWLGLPYDEDETKLAVELMQSFNKYLHDGLRENNDEIDIVLRTVDETHPGFPRTAESESYIAWDGIAEMLNQPYWHRVWIYQEATTPGPITFFCGDHSFNDILLSATIAFGITFSKFAEFPVRFIEAAGSGASAREINSARLAREKGRGRRLIDLMQEMRKADCTNPCDRVYAPLGHAVDVPPGRITVDYNKTVVDLYIDVMRFLLLETATGMSSLGFVFIPAPDSSHKYLNATFETEVPSWVPDWRQRVSIWEFSHEEFQDEDGYPLYCPLDGEPEVRIEGTVLHVQGFIVDSVVIVLLTDIFDNPKRSWTVPRAWYTQIMKLYGGHGNMNEAIRRTLVADRSVASRRRDKTDFKHTWKRGGMVDWSLFEQERNRLDEASLSTREDTEQVMFNVCHGRRMAVLKGCRLAILPAAAKHGDTIAAFRGGRALNLLRSVPGGFMLIGDCYVDGWMDGALAEEGQYSEAMLKLI